MNNIYITLTLLLLIFTSLSCSSLKNDYLIEKEKQQTQRTEEEIKKSPVLQELNTICSSVPLIDGFEPMNKRMELNKRKSLTFGYRSTKKFEEVRSFYLNFFAKNGWRVVSEAEISSEELLFEKDNFQVGIYYADLEDGANYLIFCEKLN